MCKCLELGGEPLVFVTCNTCCIPCFRSKRIVRASNVTRGTPSTSSSLTTSSPAPPLRILGRVRGWEGRGGEEGGEGRGEKGGEGMEKEGGEKVRMR